jgi:hypothetical protein
MPGPKGIFYVVELYPGCKGCTAPPGVTIYKVDNKHHLWEELQTDDWAQPMPWNKWYGAEEMPIKVGLDPDEFQKAVCDEMVAYVKALKIGGMKPRWLDEQDAYEIGEQLWGEAVNGEVSLVIADKSKD